MRPLGLRQRLLAYGAALIALTVGSGAVGVVTSMRESAAIDVAMRGDRDEARLQRRFEKALEDEDDALLASLSGEGRGALSSARRATDEAASDLLHVAPNEEARGFVVAVVADLRAYRAASDSIGAAPAEGAAAGSAARAAYRKDVLPELRRLEAGLARARERRYRALEDVVAEARDRAAGAAAIFGGASLAALALLVFVALRVARTVIDPLHELTAHAAALGRGVLGARVTPRTDDELGSLAVGLNGMAEALERVDAKRVREIEEAHELLLATLEALPEAVLVVTTEGRILRCNASARALFDAVGAGAPDNVIDLPLPLGALSAIRGAISKGPGQAASLADWGRAARLTVGGEERLYAPRVVRVELGVGEVRAVVVLDDVTDLARLDDMRTEFLAIAAHEIRTPLTTLQMTLALLEESGGRSAHEKETLSTARAGCEQLTTTVHAFLDAARAGADPAESGDEELVAEDLATRAASAVAARFAERGVSLEVHLGAAGDARVRGHEERLVTAVSNLLRNALKYGPAGGRVRLSLERDVQGVRFVVDDEGPGVPTELRERIFEKYFRIDPKRPKGERVRGMGLGLYLCRRVFFSHGGDVRCERSPLGGARFVATLPTAHATSPLLGDAPFSYLGPTEEEGPA